MRLYDKIKRLLEQDQYLRNSDKALIWRIWMECGYVREHDGIQILNRESFMKANTPESITRARRKVQENHPELQASESIKRAKIIKQNTKGTFIYREEFSGKLF